MTCPSPADAPITPSIALNDETLDEDEHGGSLVFQNPFTDDGGPLRKVSVTSESTTYYIRQNAFPGHRDTFARLGHSQTFQGFYDPNSTSLSYSAPPNLWPSTPAAIPPALVQLLSKYVSFSDYKLMRLVCRQWCQDLPNPCFSALYRLPRELIQETMSYLSPCDFDAARHTCASWYCAGQHERLQKNMLKLGFCTTAFEEDMRLHFSIPGDNACSSELLGISTRRQSADLSCLNQEWICGKHLATESTLSPSWCCGQRVTRESTLSSSRSGWNPESHKAPTGRLFLRETIDFTRLLSSITNGTQRAKFTVSACGRFVLVNSGCDISIFNLHDRKDTLKPVVRLAAGIEVLKVSMDTSSERYAVAALLAGRKGMLWELVGDMTQAHYRSVSGEPISLGMQTDIHSSASSPESREIALNLSVRSTDYHAVVVFQRILGHSNGRTDSPSPVLVPHSYSCQNEHLRQATTELPDFILGHESHHNMYSIPILANATALYTNLGSADDEPRSVAICPNRKCAAYGCRMGIELHWVDASTGGDLSRWFPLAAPSDYLYFLPTRDNIDLRKKLRLISSAAGPNMTMLTRRESNPDNLEFRSISTNPHQSMTRLLFSNLPFSAAAVSAGEWSNPQTTTQRQNNLVEGVLRTVDCDHHGAVPISDGVHLLFTDPVTNLLCLGADAPLGWPTKLLRKIVFIPPHMDAKNKNGLVPWRYTAGQELRWGVRVVLAFHDGTIVLYNVPRDLFERLQKSQNSSDAWIENQGVIGQSDLLMDSLMDSQGPISIPSINGDGLSSKVVQITGAELVRVEDDTIDDLAVDTSFGGFSMWIFCRSGMARLYNIHDSKNGRVRSRYIGENGLIYQCTARRKKIEGSPEGCRGIEKDHAKPHVTWA
ncbi:hypothetical protein LTR84_003449 [Exophiala bonariae]|uniref:F-box domain-containing protein n=1 Tax=Exophiala bonariae TaxID=1690606 RepID=A0AAV9N7W0_9EURO|nr:hypothetical protein LTR84_003449 [Exophiala bonariae]